LLLEAAVSLSRYAWFYLFVVAVEAEHEGMDVQWMGRKKL
jgi:hypothetical protein